MSSEKEPTGPTSRDTSVLGYATMAAAAWRNPVATSGLLAAVLPAVVLVVPSVHHWIVSARRGATCCKHLVRCALASPDVFGILGAVA